jgi:hypothetical protein
MARTKNKIRRVISGNAVVTLRKMAERADLPPQAFAILGILKAKGGTVGIDELQQAMKSKVESVQSMARIWAFYRSRLVRRGFISVATKKEAK